MVQVVGFHHPHQHGFSFDFSGGKTPAYFFQYFHDAVPFQIGQGATRNLNPGTLVPLAPGMAVRYGSDLKKWTNSFVRVQGASVANLWDSLGLVPGRGYPLHSPSLFLEGLHRIYLEMSRPQGFDPRMVWLLFQEWCLDLSRSFKVAHDHSGKNGIKKEFSELHQQLLLHPEKNWEMKTIAKDLGITPVDFLRQYRIAFGQTPMNHLANIRMDLAVSLLNHTDLPIQAVAYRVGFNDALYFSRAFRSKFGVSPRQFREQNPY